MFSSVTGSMLSFFTGDRSIRVNGFTLQNINNGSTSLASADFLMNYRQTNTNEGTIFPANMQIRRGRKPDNGTADGTVTYDPPFPTGWNVSVVTTALSGSGNNELRVVNTYNVTNTSFGFMGNRKDGRSGQNGGGTFGGAFDWIAIGTGP